jgi:hypothetical protein
VVNPLFASPQAALFFFWEGGAAVARMAAWIVKEEVGERGKEGGSKCSMSPYCAKLVKSMKDFFKIIILWLSSSGCPYYFFTHSCLFISACFKIRDSKSTLISFLCGLGIVKTRSPFII